MSRNWSDFNKKDDDAANKGNEADKKRSLQVLHVIRSYGWLKFPKKCVSDYTRNHSTNAVIEQF